MFSETYPTTLNLKYPSQSLARTTEITRLMFSWRLLLANTTSLVHARSPSDGCLPCGSWSVELTVIFSDHVGLCKQAPVVQAHSRLQEPYWRCLKPQQTAFLSAGAFFGCARCPSASRLRLVCVQSPTDHDSAGQTSVFLCVWTIHYSNTCNKRHNNQKTLHTYAAL